MLPEWAAGFWQCKLRDKTQDELLAIAREHKRRGLPMFARPSQWQTARF
jgi:alpha-D-xyloside xylohydrolase